MDAALRCSKLAVEVVPQAVEVDRQRSRVLQGTRARKAQDESGEVVTPQELAARLRELEAAANERERAIRFGFNTEEVALRNALRDALPQILEALDGGANVTLACGCVLAKHCIHHRTTIGTSPVGAPASRGMVEAMVTALKPFAALPVGDELPLNMDDVLHAWHVKGGSFELRQQDIVRARAALARAKESEAGRG